MGTKGGDKGGEEERDWDAEAAELAEGGLGVEPGVVEGVVEHRRRDADLPGDGVAQRGELWQVLDGTFEITLDDEVFPAAKDDRIWVARGARHRMHNTGETPARILEIAYGTFDEDDIVRLEDDYQR